MTGNKNELFFPAALNQSFLQIDAIYARHSHIDNHARGSGVLFAFEKIRCRFKNFTLGTRLSEVVE